MYADVIVDIVHSDVDKLFEYSIGGLNVKPGHRVLVPFGKRVIEGIVMRLKNYATFDASHVKSIISILEETPALTEETLLLSEYVSNTYYVTKASALRLFLPSEMRKGKVREQFKKVIILSAPEKVDEAISSLRKTAIKQKEFLCYLLDNPRVDFTNACNLFGASAVNSVINKGVCIIEYEKIVRSPYKNDNYFNKDVTLTIKQQEAIQSINSTEKTVSLVYGVTGSGKTEVYLKLIEQAINNGKSAIMLVPEISLTPQMLRQLRGRFGDSAAILHSGLSAGERFDEWWRLRTGEAKIAIGARSAVFAPLSDIGIIIIDEEHDASYQSDSSPRYVTKEVALKRAEYYGAKVVLGSATPSLESFMLAKNGTYNIITLPDRINKKPLPEVEIVDMRKEVRRGNNTPFSASLRLEIEQCLSQGRQAILFLNQRGYSKSIICTECGHVFKCESCDVSLTYHKEEDSLLCHYCGAKYKMVDGCINCGSPYIKFGGFGTEKVVLELKKLFPKSRILRMDRDTTQNKEGHFKILNDFSAKKADILVGTQMIAKGHDFPDVTLVGILDADMSLHFSDYRSAERTFQLLTQVAGRCGRSNHAGKVVMQTYSPEHSVLLQAVNYDYEGLYEREISIRSATGFPPFTHIVRVLISSAEEENTLEITKAIYQELSELYNENKDKFRFFGCMKAPILKLQGNYRYQILMRIEKNNRKLLDTIFAVSSKYNNRNNGVFLEIDPVNLV